MRRFPSKQKAIDLAVWQNYNHRFEDEYGVVLSYSNGDYLVIPKDHSSFETKELETMPEDYTSMDYTHIQCIAMDVDPLEHWETIRGMFAVASGEILRFILSSKLPLEKLIRYELACRGYDEEFNWVGFDKSEKIWLK